MRTQILVMKYYLLGKSGLRVSEICIGAMTFGEEWGWGASKQDSRKVFDAYVDAGGNFIDTANNYTEGTSEKHVGEFIASDRNRFVLATKYTSNTRRGDPNAGGNHRKNMVQSLEASLKRLNTAYIDLYWVHAWDPMTPIEEMMRALDDMVKSGKILYAGISDAPAWVVSQANTLANLKGWTEFIGIQIEYSLIERTSERELLPMASALDVGVTAWSPLGGGVLTGKYRRKKNKDQHSSDNDTKKMLSKEEEEGSRLNVVASSEMANALLKDRNLIIAEEVSKIANDVGRTPAQVALNWIRQQKLLRQQRQSKIIPIIGARNTSQIKDNLACLEFELSKEQMQRLDEVSKIELGFPHDFLAANFIKDIIYGGTYWSIYDHRA
jgi:aryl-alcohol dehydrogenase-like predicted oxidoreductase